jgi:hypothetical protein
MRAGPQGAVLVSVRRGGIQKPGSGFGATSAQDASTRQQQAPVIWEDDGQDHGRECSRARRWLPVRHGRNRQP